MFKIGEFSKLTQVSIRMLRYYDEVGLLKPEIVDKFTNYRLYSTGQIPTLNKIVFLRDLGFNISEISVTLNHWDPVFLASQLERKSQGIKDVIRDSQNMLGNIEMAKVNICQEKNEMHYNVFIKSVPSYQVFSLRRIVSNYYSEGQLWREMSTVAGENNIPISNNTFTIYHDTDYKETDVDIEICAPVIHVGKVVDGFSYRNIDPVPIMACTMVYGSFENIAGAYIAFADWLQTHHQYRMSGQNRQIVHCGPWNEKNPDKYLTEIQIPLGKKNNERILWIYP